MPVAVSEPTKPADNEWGAPGAVILLGAPGSGKGTQAKGLAAVWSVPHISTGDLLRDNRARETELGLAADQVMRQGKLVPDELVNDMVAARLEQPDTGRGYILDGYPRTLAQAEWLDRRLKQELEKAARAARNADFDVIAINIRVSYTQLLRRITGRRSCPTCHRIYNVYLQPPKVDMKCDVDSTPLVSRADDQESVFKRRMEVYASQTAPVADYYRREAKLAEVDGERSAAEVQSAILAAVAALRHAGVRNSD